MLHVSMMSLSRVASIKSFTQFIYVRLLHNDVNSTSRVVRRDVWKLKREKFMRNMLGLVKTGKAEEANELFSKMVTDHQVRPTTPLYNVVIKGYAQTGDVKSAFRLFNDLKKRGLHPSHHTYSTMFSACSKLGPTALQTLNKLMEEIERRDVKLNTQSFNAQLSALVHCGQIDKAFEIFTSESVPESSIETFGTLLLAAAKDQTNGIERCVTIWNELVKRGFNPNLYCYNTLLLCLRDGGKCDDMIQPCKSVTMLSDMNGDNSENVCVTGDKEMCLELSENGGIDWNVRVFILRGHVRYIDTESLKNFINSMNLNSVTPDIRTVSILSSIVPEFGEIIALSETIGVKLDKQVFKSAIDFRKACGDKRTTKGVLMSSVIISKEPSVLDNAKRCKDRSDVLSFLEKLKSSSDYRDIRVWEILINVCARHRMYTTLLHILKEMRNNELAISDDVIDAMDKAILKPPKNKFLIASFNGFKGYYRIWSKSFRSIEV